MTTAQIDGCLSYFDAILIVLKISLGEWDWDAIYEGGPIAITFFILYVIVGTIMLLNLLIAVRRLSHELSVDCVYYHPSWLFTLKRWVVPYCRCSGTRTTRSGKTACSSLSSNGCVQALHTHPFLTTHTH